MKILMAAMGLGIGGAETHIIELTRELRRRGFDVAVASNGGVYVPAVEALGAAHYAVPMHRRSVPCMLKSLVLLSRVIKKERPDVVHAHARIPGFLCGLLRKVMRFPLVTTAHGVFQTGFGLNLLTNWGQKTIAVSEDIREYLVKNYGLKSRDIIVTINGINTEKFSPDASPAKIRSEFRLGAGPVVCHVSRLDPESSLVARQLIEIAPRLDSELPGAQILIAGGGGVFDELAGLAERANAQTGRRTVIMAGPRTDISEILAAGDVFVGVSRAALEAMAEAKPVILAGNEGFLGVFCPETLDFARETNFCCRGRPLPTPELLLENLLYVLRDSGAAERRRLGDFGRQLVQKDYSVGRMADDCIAAYEAVRPRRYSVVMSGYYGFGNAGDEAILQSIHQNAGALGGDIAFTVLSNDPEDTMARYGCRRAVHRFSVFSVVRAVKGCDALVSGGGSLLQDHTSTRSLLYYLSIILLAELFGKKVMVYSNGIGPVRRKMNRWLVRKIVGRADVITLRDKASADELKSMGIKRDDVAVTADPVFTLRGDAPDKAARLLAESGVDCSSPFVCVSVRKWGGALDFCAKMAALCDRIAEEYGFGIVFLPMQAPGDIEASRAVARHMKSGSFILDRRYTAEQAMGIIGLSRFVIAMRLHALIFAARMGTPAAGIVYDPKVSAYLEALEMPSAGDVAAFDPDAAMRAVKDIVQNREKHSERLAFLSSRLEELARSDAERLLELLESSKKRRAR